MAFENAQATSVSDLLSKLSTFATANGWTDRALTTGGSLGLSKAGTDDTVEVQFRHDTGTPANLGIYQSLGFAGVGVAPGLHTDDSGNGTVSGTNSVLDDERHAPLDNDTNQYWFFEQDDYIHVVVEKTTTAPKQYIHFGFGVLDKFGDGWTGGAYCYGWRIDPAGGTSDMAVRGASTHILDGRVSTGSELFAATLHIEGFSVQPAGSKWGVVWGSGVGQSTDTAGNARVLTPGGFRANPPSFAFSRFSSNSEKGLIPGYPIDVWYREGTINYFLGNQPDVRGVNIEFFAEGDELTIGSDTWIAFPSFRKGSASSDTRFQGIFYRKDIT